jgi:transcription antitermination factor NusB
MACVDRALLRIGAFELMYRHDVPPKVAISEAIELSKKYSTDKSSSFVNGILDRIYQTLNTKDGGEAESVVVAEESA